MPTTFPKFIQKNLVMGITFGSILILFCLSACVAPDPQAVIITPSTFASTATRSVVPPTRSALQPTTAVPSVTQTELAQDFWQSLPVVPTHLSDRAREVFQKGAELGNSPAVFSRIGDCASAAPGFLTGFYKGYDLGNYTYLQPAVDYFHDSFKRPSLAARAGLNTAGVLTTLWTDENCPPGESLLDCQYRMDHPGFAIISLGTNDTYYVTRDPTVYERNMRVIIDKTISLGILPILATKADNLEGDHAMNATVARLALEYEIPLWNFWLAVQDLPDKGLLDGEHLTTISYLNFTEFSRPHALEYGMQMKNLTALQVLYFLWQEFELDSLP